jgi:hypothetical protein
MCHNKEQTRNRVETVIGKGRNTNGLRPGPYCSSETDTLHFSLASMGLSQKGDKKEAQGEIVDLSLDESCFNRSAGVKSMDIPGNAVPGHSGLRI